MEENFTFLDLGSLNDDDLELSLISQTKSYPSQVPVYNFEMRQPSNATAMGRISLRVSNSEYTLLYAGHIGYRVFPEYRGNHYAARSCHLLLPLARRHGINPVWITCNPDNVASIRTCEILGATYCETVDLPKDIDMYNYGERQKRRYWI